MKGNAGWPPFACLCEEYAEGTVELWGPDEDKCLDCRAVEWLLLLGAMSRIVKSEWGFGLSSPSESTFPDSTDTSP